MFGKLPDAYTQHPNYLRLFAGSVRSYLTLDVLYLTSITGCSRNWPVYYARNGASN